VSLIRRLSIKTIIFMLFFAGVGTVSARALLEGELCHVPADEVVEGDVFVLCNELLIEGRINGNVMGAARTSTISGDVTGSIYLVSGELHVSGSIGKDIHFGGLILQLEEGTSFESESGGIISANLSNTIMPDINVPGSVTNVGYQLLVAGNVGREITFWGSALTIDGNIGGDVTATVGDSLSDGSSSEIEALLIPFDFDVDLTTPGLVVSGNSAINGKLEYRAPTRGRVRSSQVEGGITYTDTNPPVIATGTVRESARTVQRYLGDVLREFATLVIVGAVVLLFAPHQMRAPQRAMQTRPLSTLGVGMLAFILSFPIFLIVALLSLAIVVIMSLLPFNTVALLSGVALGLANIGSASVFYFLAIFVARVVVALAVGRYAMRKLLARALNLEPRSLRYEFTSLMIGTFLYAMASSIPVPIIGWGVNAIALFLGLGGILSAVRIILQRFRAAGSAAPAPKYAMAGGVPMLPAASFDVDFDEYIIAETDDEEPPIGIENLPPGFEWWRD
jgi:hypothetical protein